MPSSVSRTAFFPLLVGLVVLALGPDRAAAQVFVPVSSSAIAAHIAFSTGVTWVDIDADSDLDLYVVTGFSPNNSNVLYRNDGGTFVSLASAPVARDSADTACSTWADFDNDGDVDCFISNLVSKGGMLFAGQGGGDLTLDTAAGLGGAGLKGTGCAFGDYDNDGYLDLVIAALYGQGGITTGNRLFHNNGDGTFTEVTSGPEVTTLGTHHHPTWSDYDGDGDLDLFFAGGGAGSLKLDHMYRNQLVETGNPTFQAITSSPIATDLRDSQVLSWVDIDNDGDLDLYAVNYSSVANQLYRNDGGVFVRNTGQSIVTDLGANHGVVWGDFDNDGDQDAYVVCDLGQSNRYYRNEGGGAFTSITSGAHVTEGLSNYGAAAGDMEGDGDLDLFVPTARSEGPSLLFRNDLANGNHWLILRCVGTRSNRSAVGAKARVRAVIGGAPVWQMREILAGTSYGGHSALEAHFGLGDAAEADSVRIEWPSGAVDVLVHLSADARHTVMEGQTLVGVGPSPARDLEFCLSPNPPSGTTVARFRLARDEALVLEVFDTVGRRLATPERGVFAAGTHEVRLDVRGLPGSGVYLVRLRAGSAQAVQRMVRLR